MVTGIDMNYPKNPELKQVVDIFSLLKILFFDQVKKKVCAYILTINKLHFNKIFNSNFFPLVCKLQNTIGCHFRCCSKEQCLVL